MNSGVIESKCFVRDDSLSVVLLMENETYKLILQGFSTILITLLFCLSRGLETLQVNSG